MYKEYCQGTVLSLNQEMVEEKNNEKIYNDFYVDIADERSVCGMWCSQL